MALLSHRLNGVLGLGNTCSWQKQTAHVAHARSPGLQESQVCATATLSTDWPTPVPSSVPWPPAGGQILQPEVQAELQSRSDVARLTTGSRPRPGDQAPAQAQAQALAQAPWPCLPSRREHRARLAYQ